MIRRGISKGFEGDGNRLIPDGIIRLSVEVRTDVHLCGRILHFYKGNITAGKVELLYLYSINLYHDTSCYRTINEGRASGVCARRVEMPA